MICSLQFCSVVQLAGTLSHFYSCNLVQHQLVMLCLVLQYRSLLSEVVYLCFCFGYLSSKFNAFSYSNKHYFPCLCQHYFTPVCSSIVLVVSGSDLLLYVFFFNCKLIYELHVCMKGGKKIEHLATSSFTVKMNA